MKIEKNNVRLEVNKPKVNFDTDAFTNNEINLSKKTRNRIVALTALTIGAAMLSKGLRAKKKKD